MLPSVNTQKSPLNCVMNDEKLVEAFLGQTFKVVQQHRVYKEVWFFITNFEPPLLFGFYAKWTSHYNGAPTLLPSSRSKQTALGAQHTGWNMF